MDITNVSLTKNNSFAPKTTKLNGGIDKRSYVIIRCSKSTIFTYIFLSSKQKSIKTDEGNIILNILIAYFNIHKDTFQKEVIVLIEIIFNTINPAEFKNKAEAFGDFSDMIGIEPIIFCILQKILLY